MPIVDILPSYNYFPAEYKPFQEIKPPPQRTKPIKVGQLVWFWPFNEKTPQKVMVLKIDDSLVKDKSFTAGLESITILFNSKKKIVRRTDLSTSKAASVKESFWSNLNNMFCKTLTYGKNNVELTDIDISLVSQTYTGNSINLEYTIAPSVPMEHISFTFDTLTTTVAK